MQDKILVDFVKLEATTRELITLKHNVARRRLKINIEVSKGAAIDELLELEQSLNDMGTLLSEVIGKTADEVADVRTRFMTAEKSNENMY